MVKNRQNGQWVLKNCEINSHAQCVQTLLSTPIYTELKSWVKSHQRGCNSWSGPNETKNVGTRPDLAQTPISFIKPRYEIQRLMVLYLQVYCL